MKILPAFWATAMASLLAGVTIERAQGQPNRPTSKWEGSMLVETPDGVSTMPWLSADTLQQTIDEVNRRGATRIQLRQFDRFVSQPVFLQRITAACPQLTDLSIIGWAFSESDLKTALGNLPRLQSLSLSSCRLIRNAVARDAAHEDIAMLGLKQLSVSHCHGVDNATVARWLASTQALETLSVADTSETTGEVLNGEGWPLAKLAGLRELTIVRSFDDTFIRRCLQAAPNLKSLTVWECQQIKGDNWTSHDLPQIEELSLSRCRQLHGAALSRILKRLPGLKSLTIALYTPDSEPLELGSMTELRHLKSIGLDLRGLELLTQLESLTTFHISRKSATLNLSTLENLKTASIDAWDDSTIETLPPSLESLDIPHGNVSNNAIAAMLKRLVRLRSLKLISVYGGRGYEDDPAAVTGAGWEFASGELLREIELTNCRYIGDEFVRQIARQLPGLESLRLATSVRLTGERWKLENMANLKHIQLTDLPNFVAVDINWLPQSLETLAMKRCALVTGDQWDLALLPRLRELRLQRCPALRSIGERLPKSLRSLDLNECVKFRGAELNYHTIGQLENLAFHECHPLDVDRLFAALPLHAKSLQSLDLTGCPNPTSDQWNLSPLKHILRDFAYPEGDPSYVGGVSDENFERLQKQLPNTRIVK